MVIVLGTLAMFVALAALWLGSVAMRKADEQFTELAKSMRAELAKVRGDAEEKVNVVTRRLAMLEGRLEKVQTLDQATHDTLANIRDEVFALKRDLDATRTALPPQIRARMKVGDQPTSN
jgi:DNA repair exonuclease SbcCD ATPase subunit